jgi:uncharacterized membrane protein YhiD involved in acid resistance
LPGHEECPGLEGENAVSFQDIFKKAFLDNIQSLSLPTAILSIFLAMVFGLGIFFTYKLNFSGVIYSKNYSISLIAVTVITSVIVITLATNIVLSLGMVGALSIVRFRTAIKEPMDVVYLFWAITVGIVCGAGLFVFALLAMLVIGGVFFLMHKIKDKDTQYVVIINMDKSAYKDVQELLNQTRYILRSKTINKNDIEMVLEVDTRSDKNMFVNRLSEIENVNNVSLVNYRTGL